MNLESLKPYADKLLLQTQKLLRDSKMAATDSHKKIFLQCFDLECITYVWNFVQESNIYAEILFTLDVNYFQNAMLK